MENIIALSGIVVVTSIFCLMLKKNYREMALVLSIIAGVIILFIILSNIVPVINQIKSLISDSGIDLSFGVILFKVLGICFITQFASDTCKDAGEIALSSNIELAGKIFIVVVSLPLFEEIINIIVSLMGG